MKKILNLTQHNATAEQMAAGVYDLSADKIGELRKALTFDFLPTENEIWERAEIIATIAGEEKVKTGAKTAMIGGAPYLMRALVSCLALKGITPLYSFSQRQSEESTDSNGNVVKTAVFRHVGFIEA